MSLKAYLNRCFNVAFFTSGFLFIHALPSLAGGPIGPSPYLSFSDSPFDGLVFEFFYLENFEDGVLNTPGVTPSSGDVTTSSGFTGAIIDSVENYPNGDSYFSGSGPTGISFSFSQTDLGEFPTHAGLVWTDGTNSISFEAFDENGSSLGITGGSHAGLGFDGVDQAEDRFYGAIHSSGISSIKIFSGSGGIEIDHLQYGFLNPNVPSQPTSVPGPLPVLGAATAYGYSRKLRKRLGRSKDAHVSSAIK